MRHTTKRGKSLPTETANRKDGNRKRERTDRDSRVTKKIERYVVLGHLTAIGTYENRKIISCNVPQTGVRNRYDRNRASRTQ